MARFKSNFTQTIEKAKQTLEGNDFRDDRFWYSQHDRKKDCTCTLRLMPSKPKGNSYGELCYVIESIHKFEYVDRNGRKKNFWSPCAKKLAGQDCPECDKVADLWDKYNGQKDGWDPKDERLRKKLSLHENFVCNVIVIDDPTNPENNDGVFLTKFQAKGPSVPFKDVVLKQLNPSDSDKKKKTFKQINPFEPYDVEGDDLPGCNFYLDYKAPGKSDSYGNYNSSEFIKNECGAVYEDETKIDEAMDKLHDLNSY
ncbi:MAG: hypothetical protein PHF26_04265, partial [Candidatus Gracilibacteria bacterium]|nr:hypothetical protein [Candidatus Gracilibacteria bacterium]